MTWRCCDTGLTGLAAHTPLRAGIGDHVLVDTIIIEAVRNLRTPDSAGKVLVQADSAFYGHPTGSAAIRGGARSNIGGTELGAGRWG